MPLRRRLSRHATHSLAPVGRLPEHQPSQPVRTQRGDVDERQFQQDDPVRPCLHLNSSTLLDILVLAHNLAKSSVSLADPRSLNHVRPRHF